MPFQTISSHDLYALLTSDSPPVIIDVRELIELQDTGHIPDAQHVPLMSFLAQSLSELSLAKDTRIVINCHLGSRSAAACHHLAHLGCTHVHNLAGGIDAWIAAGLPIER